MISCLNTLVPPRWGDIRASRHFSQDQVQYQYYDSVEAPRLATPPHASRHTGHLRRVRYRWDLPDFPTLADFSLNNVLKKDRNQSLCVAVVFIVIVDGMRIHVE